MIDVRDFTPSLKTLRHISKYIGQLSPEDTIEFLEECGVSNNLIERHKNSPKIVYHIFKELASSDKKEQHNLLVKIISDSTDHTLYKEPNLTEEEIFNTYNVQLKLDRLQLLFSDINHEYQITTYLPELPKYKKIAQNDFKYSEEIMFSIMKHYRGNIAEIKIAYSLLLEIVDVFSRQSFPVDKQLNEFYVKLVNIIKKNIEYVYAEIKTAYEKEDESPEMLPSGEYISSYVYKVFGENILHSPFPNLYLAEEVIQRDKTPWVDIKKKMDTCYGFLQASYHKYVADTTIKTSNHDLFNRINKYIQNLSINTETTVLKKQEIQEYAFQLYLDGDKLFLKDNIYNNRARPIRSLIKQGSSTILKLTMQTCRRSPTKLMPITIDDLKGKLAMIDKFLGGDIQKQRNLFKKYISNLGLQHELKDIFYANDPNGELGFKFRTAITMEEWNKKSEDFQNKVKQEVVKLLNINPDKKDRVF